MVPTSIAARTPRRLFGSYACVMSYDRLRAFLESDIDACVALMRNNTPEFFTRSELAGFEGWLRSNTSPYLVIEDDRSQLIACGGYRVDVGDKSAGLTWGMVARSKHRQGIGSLLLRERLKRIAADGRVLDVVLDTSQHSRGFFQRHGFRVVSIQADGYGPGLDRCDMPLSLPDYADADAAAER
jgi:ribosomal protein S18 acetylase RimI-like enzyme